MGADSAKSSKAVRGADVALVASYHEARLGDLLERVRKGFERYDSGELDAFELDELIHRYKRATRELWKFCGNVTGSSAHVVASTLEEMQKRGETIDWWERGGRERRRRRQTNKSQAIVLLGCVKTKRSETAPAKDLYVSPLWRARREYAEASGAPWFILSAKHGLVRPDEPLDPYEVSLQQRPARERRDWGEEVVADLEAALGELRGAEIEIHAGAPYRDATRPPFERRGASPANPLAGLSIGEQLAWYSSRGERPPRVDAGRGTMANLDAAIDHLGDMNAALPAHDWPGELSSLDQCGLYSWWVDQTGARHLATGLEHEVAAGLIYAGQAGATKWPSGQRSKATLASRIGGNHIRGRVKGSTFRLTLAAALRSRLDLEIVGPTKLAPDSERRISDWIRDHLAVVTLSSPDPDGLGSLEEAVLDRLDPSLNLNHRPPSPLRERLSQLRAVVAAGAAASGS